MTGWGHVSLWNRLLVSVVALVVLAAAVITLLVAGDRVDPDVLPDRWFEAQLTDVATSSGSDLALNVAVATIVAVAMFFLLLLEIIPMRPMRRLKALPIPSTDQGTATIDPTSVRLLAEGTGAGSRNVRGVRCSVEQTPGGPLVIRCRATVALGANVPEVSAELQSKIKEQIEQLTGLRVAQVDVRVTYESGKQKRRVLAS